MEVVVYSIQALDIHTWKEGGIVVGELDIEMHFVEVAGERFEWAQAAVGTGWETVWEVEGDEVATCTAPCTCEEEQGHTSRQLTET